MTFLAKNLIRVYLRIVLFRRDDATKESIIWEKIMKMSSRRQFLKGAAITVALSTCGKTLHDFLVGKAHAKVPLAPVPQEFFYSACTTNCGSACALKYYTVDGKVVRVGTDNMVKDDWDEGILQVRACPRGRSLRKYAYQEERLKYPMKRVGKRGEGKFERISWDEALEELSTRLKDCIAKYGNESVYCHYGSGVQVGALSRREPLWRLLNLTGGFGKFYSDYSSAANQAGMNYLYGMRGYTGNAITDIQHTKLAVFFGLNTTETRMSGGGLQYELLQAKEKSGAKIIVIDPRFSETCVTVADEWIPIRPGTDAALASAIAYVLIKENMVDLDFVRQYVQGFDNSQMPESAGANESYSDYILGTGYDKIAKTPEWASKITGIAKERILQLAREIGQAKPAYIAQGWGIQRQAAGEMNSMAVSALAVLTGNIGIRGGNTGDRDAYFPIPVPRMDMGNNPVQAAIPVFQWLNAIDHGHTMTPAKDGVTGVDVYPTDLKFIWNYAGNALINQNSEINHTKKILADETKLEHLVVIDTHMTASAMYADILLPSCTFFEVSDIYGSSYSNDIDYYIFSGSAKPYYEARSLYDICVGLSQKLGLEQEFTLGRTGEDWVDFHYQTICRKQMPHLPATLEEARKQGIWRKKKSRDLPIKTQAFREDPIANPLNTPSGKIELYSEPLVQLAKERGNGELLGEVIVPTPQYIVTYDSYEDEEKRKNYPLQMIGHHYKGRTHSTYAACEWLLEIMPQTLWINPVDAKKRGLEHGDKAIVYNDRGEVEISVKVTPRIMPGVISMPQGAWYKPDAKGLDKGGCINTLTIYRPTHIAKANPQHTNLVEVRKA